MYTGMDAGLLPLASGAGTATARVCLPVGRDMFPPHPLDIAIPSPPHPPSVNPKVDSPFLVSLNPYIGYPEAFQSAFVQLKNENSLLYS